MYTTESLNVISVWVVLCKPQIYMFYKRVFYNGVPGVQRNKPQTVSNRAVAINWKTNAGSVGASLTKGEEAGGIVC